MFINYHVNKVRKFLTALTIFTYGKLIEESKVPKLNWNYVCSYAANGYCRGTTTFNCATLCSWMHKIFLLTFQSNEYADDLKWHDDLLLQIYVKLARQYKY